MPLNFWIGCILYLICAYAVIFKLGKKIKSPTIHIIGGAVAILGFFLHPILPYDSNIVAILIRSIFSILWGVSMGILIYDYRISVKTV
jgi:membrane-bound ClpP family serine protease